MHNKRTRIVVGLLAVCFVALLSAYAQGEKTKVKGLITARTGDTIVLKTTRKTVTLDEIPVQQPKGLGIRKKQMSGAVLIPVKVWLTAQARMPRTSYQKLFPSMETI
jgi:hypothetical protein